MGQALAGGVGTFREWDERLSLVSMSSVGGAPGRAIYASLSTSNHYRNTNLLVHITSGPKGKTCDTLGTRGNGSASYLLVVSGLS